MSAIDSLAALLKAVDPLSPAMIISDVADQLLQPAYKAFLSLPVVDDQQRPLGLISRYRQQDIFMQRFGRDLWGKRSVTEAVNPNSLVIALDTPLKGGIFRYLTKPWDQQAMADTLTQAAQIVLHRRRFAKGPVAVPAAISKPKPVRLQLIDDDPENQRLNGEICQQMGVQLQTALTLDAAVARLNEEEIDILLTDIRLGKDDLRPLLMTLAQAHPQLLSIVITPFQDTELLLKLINQAQIFRYLPKPIRRGMLERAIKKAVTRVEEARQQPAAPVMQQAEAPRAAEERRGVSNFMGMLGRLRQRLSA